mmetsp:Transcript_8904/g.29686  ORF Transcript_8904/g.29686 Transcript_8904/m.29686 type:complete len:207 (+) Transcript_8904:4189-4809(+)
MGRNSEKATFLCSSQSDTARRCAATAAVFAANAIADATESKSVTVNSHVSVLSPDTKSLPSGVSDNQVAGPGTDPAVTRRARINAKRARSPLVDGSSFFGSPVFVFAFVLALFVTNTATNKPPELGHTGAAAQGGSPSNGQAVPGETRNNTRGDGTGARPLVRIARRKSLSSAARTSPVSAAGSEPMPPCLTVLASAAAYADEAMR